jgi:uncharacterized membrane protein YbhN (UPF0104 family)
MTSAQLESPVDELARTRASDPSRSSVGSAPPTSAQRRWWITAGTIAVIALSASLLGLELRSAHPGDVVAHLRVLPLVSAMGWIALSLVAAAYNLSGFSAVRIPLRRSLLAQLAISGLRVITPSAVSTPVVATRFLTRSGATLSDAGATVGLAQGVQLIATTGVVAGLAVSAGTSGPTLPGGAPAIIGLAVAAGAVTVLGVLARRSVRARLVLTGFGASLLRLMGHARHHPAQLAGGVLASAALTLTHVLAFAACVAAVGGHTSLFTLAAVYLGGASAGSLLPTPGGIGGVEATLIAGLTAAGVPVSSAAAATLLSRLVAVWLPAGPGWWAVLRLRRAGLL